MYLISIYFDEETEKQLKGYMKQIAKHTGNAAMLEGEIPPHITISQFRADCEETALKIVRRVQERISAGELWWVSVGSFFPQILYAAPILNEYLHEIATITFEEASIEKGVEISRFYQPFQWMPHTTLGKRMTKEQLRAGVEVLQSCWGPIRGKVTKLGLAKTNPYTDIEAFVLK